MDTETEYVYFEFHPGVDVYDAAGELLGTVESIWGVSASGEHQELASVQGVCPPVEGAETPAARFCLTESGYLVVTSGLLQPKKVVIPFQMIDEVAEERITLSQTKDELTEQAPIHPGETDVSGQVPPIERSG